MKTWVLCLLFVCLFIYFFGFDFPDENLNPTELSSRVPCPRVR